MDLPKLLLVQTILHVLITTSGKWCLNWESCPIDKSTLTAFPKSLTSPTRKKRATGALDSTTWRFPSRPLITLMQTVPSLVLCQNSIVGLPSPEEMEQFTKVVCHHHLFKGNQGWKMMYGCSMH